MTAGSVPRAFPGKPRYLVQMGVDLILSSVDEIRNAA